MAGGKWESQNKVLNGAYVNVETDTLVAAGIDSRGRVAIPVEASWGEPLSKVKVTPLTDFKAVFGKELKEMPYLREALKGNGGITAFILNGKDGEKAKSTAEADLKVMARFPGAAGNGLTVSKTFLVGDEDETLIEINEYHDGLLISTGVHEVESGEEGELKPLKINGAATEIEVTFTAQVDETVTLSGGTDGTITNASWTAFLEMIDGENVKAFTAYPEDDTVKDIVAAQVKVWRDGKGKKLVVAMADYAQADYEGVISIINGVTLSGDIYVTPEQAASWYAAAYANAGPDSLTAKEYPGAIDCDRMPDEDLILEKLKGNVTFIYEEGADGLDKIIVESDINTLTSFTPKKNRDFSKGKILRAMDHLVINIQHIWNRYFKGKIANTAERRELFKAQLLSAVIEPMERMEMFEEPVLPDDIIMSRGHEKDAVVADVYVKFADAAEKLYVTVHAG